MGRLLRPNGDKIRYLRVRKGWPREQLAQIAGEKVRTIRRVEAGGTASFETLRAVAEAFGLEVHELMRGSAGASTRTAALSAWILRLLSAETVASFVAWCMPYAPAAKGLMTTFAMIILAASAIALSPLLVDREEDSMIVDSSQSLSPAQTVARTDAGEARPVLRTRPATDNRPASTRETRQERPVQPAGTAAPPVQAPAPASASARNDLLPAEHPNLKPATQASVAVQVVAGVIHTDWLRNLAQPVSTRLDFFGPSHSKALTAPPVAELAGSANRSSGGGYGILGRPFVRSGKSTAAFFSKVGSSIRRVF